MPADHRAGVSIEVTMYSPLEVKPADSAANSLWEKTSPPPLPLPVLEDEQTTEIAIIGAGIAGLSLAYHLARQGASPIVLEAGEPGENATGRSGGIISSLPARHGPQAIIKRHGEQEGGKILSLFGNSAIYTFALIKQLGLDCAPQQSGFLCPALHGRTLDKLKTISAGWQSLGYDIQYLDEKVTAELSGLDIYGGALLDPNGGTINPLAYVRELVRVALESGVKLYAHSRVGECARSGKTWRLQTRRGSVTAQKIILCAGGDNRYLHKRMAKSTLPLGVFELSTAPADARLRKRLLPEGHSLTDAHSDVFTIRYDADGRLITACPFFLFYNSPEKAIKHVMHRLRSLSPLFDSVRITDVWQGAAWFDKGLLPQFYPLDANLYGVQACNGRGLAMNTLLGHEIARFILSGPSEDSNLISSTPRSIKPYAVMRHALGLYANTTRSLGLIMNRYKDITK